MENKTISEYALEVVCTRLDKINHRLVIVLVITIILLFGSNAAWLYAWMQYDYESETTTTETVTVDGKDGIANYANHGGSVVNGSGEIYDNDSQEEDTQEEEWQ